MNLICYNKYSVTIMFILLCLSGINCDMFTYTMNNKSIIKRNVTNLHNSLNKDINFNPNQNIWILGV